MAQERERGNLPGAMAHTVGANVHSRRNQIGISARELAEKLTEHGRRFTLSGVQKVERAERRVDVDDLQALAVALDTDASTLLGLQGPALRSTLRDQMEISRRFPDLGRALRRALIDEKVSADLLLDYAFVQIRTIPGAARANQRHEELFAQLRSVETVAEAVAIFEDPAVAGEPGEPSGLVGLAKILRDEPDGVFPGRPEFAGEVADELERRGW